MVPLFLVNPFVLLNDNMFYTRYNHKTATSPCGGVSMTDQQFRSECDINSILARYQITGTLPSRSDGFYGDFSNVGDFAKINQTVKKATDSFLALPSSIRERFGNNVESFYAFVSDPTNENECRTLGLLPPTTESQPSVVDLLKDIRASVTASAENPA